MAYSRIWQFEVVSLCVYIIHVVYMYMNITISVIVACPPGCKSIEQLKLGHTADVSFTFRAYLFHIGIMLERQ